MGGTFACAGEGVGAAGVVGRHTEAERVGDVHLIFVDDSTQAKPSRPGFTGKLVAVGGFVIHADEVRGAERALGSLCKETGFPPGAEFKWSPGREDWITKNLVEDERTAFFDRVLGVVAHAGASVYVVMEDDGRAYMNPSAKSPQHDVMQVFFERTNGHLGQKGDSGLLVADVPSGNRSVEKKFVADCLETIASGTRYVRPDNIAVVLTSDSRHVHLLQAADLIVSSMTAYVAGERTYSPPTARRVLELCPSTFGNRGGTSVKIHPDYNFMNLYHWLLGDESVQKYGIVEDLPIANRSYANSPDVV